jgi:hypothetical protein
MQHESLARDSEQNTQNTCDMHSAIHEEKRRGYGANCRERTVETTKGSVLFNESLS